MRSCADGAVMAAEKAIALTAMSLGIIAGTLVLFAMTLEAQRGRDRRSRNSVEAEWRIHQIDSDARAQMWDEITHHRESGGG